MFAATDSLVSATDAGSDPNAGLAPIVNTTCSIVAHPALTPVYGSRWTAGSTITLPLAPFPSVPLAVSCAAVNKLGASYSVTQRIT